MSHRTARVDEIPPDDVDGLEWRPVRGDLVIEDHDEDEHAAEPDSTIIAIGAPGDSFEASEWETRWLQPDSG
jgi:hypothetical protein